MSAQIIRRSVAALSIAVLAAGIATGCGGSDAPTSNPSLSFVPEAAAGYLMADSNVSGAGWTQFDKLASSVAGWSKVRSKLTRKVNEGSFTFTSDVKPWLGKHVGIALVTAKLKMSGSASQPAVVMVESKNDKRALASLKSRKSTSVSRLEGSDVYRDAATDMYWVVKDGVVLLADKQAWLRSALQAHSSGDNITKDDGATSARKRVSSKAVVWIVVGSRGYEQLMKDARKSVGTALSSSVSSSRLNDAFDGAAMDFVPAANGIRAHIISLYDTDKLKGKRIGGTQFAPKMMQDVPAGAYLAYTNMNLGGLLKQVVKAVKRQDGNTAQAVTGAQTLFGITDADLASAYRDEFTLFAGPGKSLSLLVTNVGDATADTTRSLLDIARFASGTRPVDLKLASGDFRSTTIRDVDVIAGSTSTYSLVTTDKNIAARIGTGPSLADSARFTNAVAASGMPSKVDGFMYLDPTAAVTALATMKGRAASEVKAIGTSKALGPMVVWITSGSDSQAIEMFVQIKQ